MSTTVILIRHGTFDGAGAVIAGWSDGFPLNAQGRAQMKRVSGHLAALDIAALYSSPLERTWESALIVGEACGLGPERSEPLGELRFGDWSGRSIADLPDAAGWREFNALRSFAPTPEGELQVEVQARAIRAIAGWRTTHPGQVVAAVTHADVIRAVLSYALGAPLDLAGRIEIAPASTSALELGADFIRVLCVNGTGENLLPP